MSTTTVVESWYVRIVHSRENSIGRCYREATVISFHSLQKAFEYWADRTYLLRCTDLLQLGRRESWKVESPVRHIPVMDGFKKKRYIDDYMIEWQ